MNGQFVLWMSAKRVSTYGELGFVSLRELMNCSISPPQGSRSVGLLAPILVAPRDKVVHQSAVCLQVATSCRYWASLTGITQVDIVYLCVTLS